MPLSRQVWADNLDEELDSLRATIEKYPVVSMVSELFIRDCLYRMAERLTTYLR
jgi:hypothetical protein